jgi:hypothetical protein
VNHKKHNQKDAYELIEEGTMTDISEKKEETRGRNGDKTAGFDKLKENWPSPFVSREHIGEFTGGLLKHKPA